MKVLLIGATGNVGIRLVPALLTHGHNVVTYVRSANKLESLLPASVYQQITVIEGNATDSAAIKKAILESKCEGVVNTAGVAVMAPWKKGELPTIFRAVLEGVRQAGEERKVPLRTWFMAGLGVLHYPGTQTMLSSYMPVYLEHRQNYSLLQSLPANAVDWSMLCPVDMTPESSDFSVPTKSAHARLTANAGTPPMWNDSWMRHIPLIGKTIVVGMNFSRYVTTLEQNADFIASDLETYESRWSMRTVGVIDASR